MRDGYLNKCKQCVRAYNRKRYAYLFDNSAVFRERERHRNRKRMRGTQYRAPSPRRRANSAVKNAIRDGRLTPGVSCEDCGHKFSEERREAHHLDYDKPLDVHWLCSLCHGKRHRLPV